MPIRVFAIVLLAAACLIAGLGREASAADLKPFTGKALPPAPVRDPIPNWAGFYLGGQVGYAVSSARFENIGTSALFSPPGSITTDRGGGIIGGGQVGYNFQAGRWVFGLEASMSGADLDRSFTSPYVATDTWSSRLDWLGTVTGRVGYAVGDVLPYIKGGFATGNVETKLASNITGVTSQGSSQHYGYTLGAGLEYKVTPTWSLGLEYLYTDLGRRTDISGPPSGAVTAENYSTGMRTQSIMGRLNYLFGW